MAVKMDILVNIAISAAMRAVQCVKRNTCVHLVNMAITQKHVTRSVI